MPSYNKTQSNGKPSWKIRIGMAEDDREILSYYEELFENSSETDLVFTAKNGASFLRKLNVYDIDLALLDIDMPGVDGIEVAGRISRNWPQIVPVMFTVFEQPDSLGRALQAGAQGFLTKDMAFEDVVVSLRKALKGDIVMSPRPIRTLSDAYVNHERSRQGEVDFLEAVARVPEHFVPLLNLLIRGASSETIESTLGYTSGTTRNKISKLLRTLGCKDRSEVTLRALRAGFPGREA